jgi:hypothetical protein
LNRVKVKTREQVKSVKALDRAAVAGVRMKNAYVRTKEKAVRNREDRNNTPTGYAGERVQEYARRMARNAVRTVRFGGKAIKQKGRVIFQRYRNSRDGTPPAEHDFTSPKGVTYKEVPFGEDAPLSSRQNPAAQRQQYRRYFYRLKKPLPQERLEEPEVSSYAPTPNLITKRGREFAKKQAAKRRVDMREIKTKEQISFIQKEKPTPDFLPTTSHKMLPKTALQDKEASPALPSRKLLVQKKRTVRTVSPTNTPRPMVKGLRHEVKAVPQAARRAAKAGQKAARLAARSAAATAKMAAKVSMAAAKAALLSAKTLAAAIAAGGWVAVLVVVVICLVGQLACSGLGIFFAGEDSGTGQTVTTAVQEIDLEFGDRLAEIQASVDHDILDLSGSPAPWPDVLAVYAVKTTSDPDNGQEVVTMDDARKQLLRAVFWEMNSISSSVTVRTYEVSSTTTTDENGNIVESTDTETEVTLHITISHKTSSEMADVYRFNDSQREQLDFLLSPENCSLWDALLQRAGAGGGNGGDLVSVALSQVGNVGGQPYWSWYGFDSRVEWCACFVSWCANESGCLGTMVPKFSRCVDGVAWFRGQGRWQNSGYLPRPGEIIFFDWNGDMVPDHVGIVEKVDGGVIYTIEGNSAWDRCRENQYAIGSSLILGYGIT